MSRENPDLALPELSQTMITFLDRANELQLGVDYRLCGTAAAVIQGVAVPTNDIDILVENRSDVDGFAWALSPCKCITSPEWLPEAKQYFAEYETSGVEIGFSTVEIDSDRDTIGTFGRGPWKHYVDIPCGPYTVPAVALELRLHTELHRNRPDRYRPTIQYLEKTGCDHDLMSRCIAPPCDLDVSLKHIVQKMVADSSDKRLAEA